MMQKGGESLVQEFTGTQSLHAIAARITRRNGPFEGAES